MNNIVGIQIDVRENASSVAPRVVDRLSAIGAAGEEAGEKIQNAFDTSEIQKNLERFADKIDKVFGKERELKIKNLELRNQAMEKRLEEGTRAQGGATSATTPGRFVARAGSTLAGVGDTGNVMPAAGNVLENVGGMVSKAGPVGMIAGAITALVGGVALVVDALSKQYEAFVPDIMDTTAAFGDLKKTVGENSATFRDSMDKAAKSAAYFGYSLEQGMEIRKGLAKGGLSSAMAGMYSDQIFGYARGYGVDPASLVGAQVLGARYYQGNVLGMAAGGLSASGMGAGRYDEYLQAMSGMFEASLAKGVVKGFGEISSTMNFFSKLGETWKGQLGATRIGQISSAFEGATGLQKETDVLMYRAAQSMLKKSGGGVSYIDVMKLMEGGVSPQLFRAFGEQLKSTTGGSYTDMVEMMREAMGTNYTTAVDLVASLDTLSKMTDKDIAALLKTAEPPKADSIEMQLMKAEQDLRLEIVRLGSYVIEAKKDFVKGAGDVVKALGEFAGASPEAAKAHLKAIDDKATTESFAKTYGPGFVSTYMKKLAEEKGIDPRVLGVSGAYDSGITSSLYGVMTDPKYLAQQKSAGGIMDLLTKTSRGATTMMLSGRYKGELEKGLSGIGDKDVTLDPGEMDAFLPIFTALQKKAESDMAAMLKRAGSTGKIGSLSLLKMYGGRNEGLPSSSTENIERSTLDRILTYGGKNRGALESALTGMTTGQIELLEQTGGFSRAMGKSEKNMIGMLTDKGVLDLIAALKDLTREMSTPMTVTTEDATK